MYSYSKNYVYALICEYYHVQRCVNHPYTAGDNNIYMFWLLETLLAHVTAIKYDVDCKHKVKLLFYLFTGGYQEKIAPYHKYMPRQLKSSMV